jgi:LPXTG-motif cell wall-anchored protein
VRADDAGAVVTRFTVRRTFRTSEFGEVDCRRDDGGCMLVVGGAQDPFDRADVPLQFAPDPVEAPGGLPRTGAPSLPLAALGAGLCLVGALFLVGVRTRARAAIEWHPERDTTS